MTGQISLDPDVGTLVGTELIPVVSGGVNKTTTPLEIAAYVGKAWTAFTATVTPGAGAITTQSSASSFIKVGKTLFFRIAVTITTAGTASGNPTIALPGGNTFAGTEVLIGRDTGGTGKLLSGTGLAAGATFLILNYDNSTITWANGMILAFTGVCEVQ